MMHGLHQRPHIAQTLDGACCTVHAGIDSADGARKRLAQIGVWREAKTGRIDVPAIYRLGSRLARRGGVPLKRDGEGR